MFRLDYGEHLFDAIFEPVRDKTYTVFKVQVSVGIDVLDKHEGIEGLIARLQSLKFLNERGMSLTRKLKSVGARYEHSGTLDIISF